MGAGNDLSNAVSKLMTINSEFNHINDAMKRLERGLDEVSAKVSDHESRILKLEAERGADKREREADKRELQAEIARFKAEAERFEMRLSRQLPPPSN